MNTSPGLLNFTSKEPKEILFEMFRIRQRILLGENIEMPLITLLLWPEGQQVSGFILDIKSEKQDHHVAIQLGGYQSTGDIFYAYLGGVRGVIVHDIERYEHLFTEVTSETKMNKPPSVSKLEVRKRLDSESKSLSEKINSTIPFGWQGELPEASIHLFVINNLITDVSTCLKQLAITDIGKQAISESIQKVIFIRSDEDFKATINNNSLTIEGNFKTSFTTSEGRWKLNDLLENLL